mmetsp:Transcript_11004/g.11112  ORF Transcript_11004/g.11112 Transcript_11004/m.11112 type:complete len:224 (+) Transcript_11004:2080-2751(+)
METFLMKQYKPNISVGWSCVPSWHTAQVNPSSSCMASISSIHDNCFLADVDDDVDDNACFVEILFLPPLLLLMLLLGEVTAFNTAVTRSLEVAIAPMMEARDDTAEDADVVDAATTSPAGGKCELKEDDEVAKDMVAIVLLLLCCVVFIAVLTSAPTVCSPSSLTSIVVASVVDDGANVVVFVSVFDSSSIAAATASLLLFALLLKLVLLCCCTCDCDNDVFG